MASTLRIKVSEEKYRETINKLGEKISELQECLSRLQNLKNKLSSAYTGPAAEKALDALQQNEQNVKTTLEKVQKQKEKIQQYIDSMGSWKIACKKQKRQWNNPDRTGRAQTGKYRKSMKRRWRKQSVLMEFNGCGKKMKGRE